MLVPDRPAVVSLEIVPDASMPWAYIVLGLCTTAALFFFLFAGSLNPCAARREP